MREWVAVVGVFLLSGIALGQQGPKILVAGVPDSVLAEIKAAVPRANLLKVSNEKEALEQAADADA